MDQEIKKIGMIKLAGRPVHIARVVGCVFWSLPTNGMSIEELEHPLHRDEFYDLERAIQHCEWYGNQPDERYCPGVREWQDDGKVRGVVWTTPAKGRKIYAEILPGGVGQIWVNFIGGSLEAAKRVLEHADQYLSPEEMGEIKVWYVEDKEATPPISFEEAMAHLESVPT